jgi:ArsR family transcriptional regulator
VIGRAGCEHTLDTRLADLPRARALQLPLGMMTNGLARSLRVAALRPRAPARRQSERPGPARDRLVEILRIVAHPLRLGILTLLCERAEHVSALAAKLDVTPAAISRALSPLRAAKLVVVARRNRFATYRLAGEGMRDLVRCLERLEAGAYPPARPAELFHRE